MGLISRDKSAGSGIGVSIAGIGGLVGKITDTETVGKVEQAQMCVKADTPFAGDAVDPVSIRNNRAVAGKTLLLVPVTTQLCLYEALLYS